jgi:hypothetical protein
LLLTIKNFIQVTHIPIEAIYKKYTWSRLKQSAGKLPDFAEVNEIELFSTIKKKWLATNSLSYFNFIIELAKKNFEFLSSELSESQRIMLLMLHYDVWQEAGGFSTLEKSINAIGKNPILVQEIIELLEYKIDQLDFKEFNIELPFIHPLKLHSRYTRDQILTSFGLSTFEKQSSNREGVAENKAINTEILFVDLVKTNENFSPTTMYDDYAINEILFHWQSQNQTRSDTGKGITYIKHQENNKIILLFVREQSKDEYKNTMGYVFVGKANYIDHYGSKPVSITWQLEEPMPNYLWKQAAKLAVG